MTASSSLLCFRHDYSITHAELLNFKTLFSASLLGIPQNTFHYLVSCISSLHPESNFKISQNLISSLPWRLNRLLSAGVKVTMRLPHSILGLERILSKLNCIKFIYHFLRWPN